MEQAGERFAVVRPLGRGSMATVDLVRDLRDGALYARKRIALAAEEETDILRREFRVRTRLAHPQVPAAYELEHGDEHADLLLEYVDGEDLVGALASLGEEWLAPLLAQGLNAVAWLHRRGVLHGDLKPENLCVHGSGSGVRPLLRLLDFGTAIERYLGESEWLGGTPAFLAPYLKASGRPGPKADLYALGSSFEKAIEASLPETVAPPAHADERSAVRAVLDRLVHPDPDLTFPDAEGALADLLARCPRLECVDLPVPKDPLVVGRDRERARFEEMCAEMETGLLHRSVVVCRGAEGAGKSRLLAELARDAVLAGRDVVRLRCPERCTPLEPILELFARILPPEDPGHAELARVLAPAASAGQAPGFSQRLLRDLAALARARGLGRLVIVLDDLEHADEPTLEFLRIFSRFDPRSGPVVLAGGEPGFGEEEEGIEVWPLEPLSNGAIRELSASLLPVSEGTAERLDDIAILGEGNPQRAVHLARALHQGEGDASAGAARSGERWGEQWGRRLVGLVATERSLLDDLAVLERETPLAVLREVVSTAEVLENGHLDHLVAEGLVELEVRGSGRSVRLRSASLRAHLVERMDVDARRERHARALEAWERWPLSMERPLDMLARHAIGAGNDARALDLGRAGVRELLSRGSLRGAEDLARTLLDRAKEIERPVRAELQSALAEALIRSGRPAAAREVLEVGSASSEPGASEGLVRSLRLLGTALDAVGDLRGALASFERAAAFSGEEVGREERGRVCERLGAVRYRLLEHEEARAAWEKGLALLPEEEASLVRGDLLNDLGVLHWTEGDLERAAARHEAALEIRRVAGDLDGEARSLSNLANVELSGGSLTRAAELYGESLRLKRVVGSPASLALTLQNLGRLSSYRGDYEKGFACLSEAIELRERIGDRQGAAGTRRVRATLLHEKGEWRRAAAELTLVRDVLEDAEGTGAQLAGLLETEAAFALARGRPRRACALATRGLEELGGPSPAGLYSKLLRSRGTAYLATGERERAREDLARATEWAEKSRNPWEEGWSRLALARVSHPDEPVRAREDLGQAEAWGRRMGAPLLVAESLVTRFEHEAAGVATDTAAGWILEAERLVARIAVPETQLRVWYWMGLLARRSGLIRRAVQWWRKGVELLESSRDAFEDANEYADFIASGDRGAVVHALAALLEHDRDAAGVGMEDTMENRDKDMIEGLRDLLGRSQPYATPAQIEQAKLPPLAPEAFERLLEVSRTMNALSHREEVLAYLRDRLEELFSAENSKVILVDPDGAFRLMGESKEASRLEISRTLLERVRTERRPILVPDATHDPELHDKSSVHRLGLVSVLCAPLVVDEEILGMIQFEHRSKPGPFTEEDLAVLELFAHQAATSLKNLLLREKLDESVDRMRASEARLVANERLRALGEMSAGVAHDFNNLLTIIVGITDLMRSNENLPASLRKDVETLETVSETAAGTVRRLQEFRGTARPGAPGLRLDPVRVVRQASELGKRRFDDRRFEVQMDFEEVPEVLGHESEFREVLLNLIINAFEAMPAGGMVTVRTRRREGRAVIEVEDRGTGIQPELRQRIFEPFFSTKPNGQGMGLAVSWGIVRRMKGAIEALPADGGGTLFRVTLPPAPAETPDEVPSLSALGAASSAHILVVDDDPVVREVICRMLATAGFHPVGSGDGREAVALFEREPFDLVLTDYAMPEMDGLQVAREIKRIRSEVPVVLLTGRSPVAESGPFNLVLEKPITTRKLAAALHLGSRN